MKALTYRRYGGPDVVEVTEVDKPVAGDAEVLVRVRASAVNTSDWRIRAAAFPGVLAVPGRLIYGLLRPRNQRLGSEFAGEIEAIGPGATRFRIGDRVYGVLPGGGASAEYLAASETAAIAAIPAGLDFEQAAALPFGGLCALTFLQDFAALRPGMRLLIVGASGGVGAYAVRVAKALGADVTGVASISSQAFVKSLGADVVVDYRKTDIARSDERFDVVFDTIGVLSPRQSRRLLVTGGVFLPLNFGLRELGAALLNFLRSRKIRIAVNEDTAEGLSRLSALVDEGRLRPVVDQRFTLADAARAHAHVQKRHRQGAVILTI